MDRACQVVLISSLFSVLLSCATAEKTRNDNYVPAAQHCTTETDPDCIGKVTGGLQIPLPEARDKSKPVDKSSIFGRCELEIEGEGKTKPCDGIKLIVHSVRENEVRTAVFDGYNFKIEDLNKDAYNLEAAAPNYDILTDTKKLSPGQNVKIRVKARPHQ